MRQAPEERRERSAGKERDMSGLANILWTVIVILFVLWVLGLVLKIGGGVIHLLLVVAVVLIIWNLIQGRRAV